MQSSRISLEHGRGQRRSTHSDRPRRRAFSISSEISLLQFSLPPPVPVVRLIALTEATGKEMPGPSRLFLPGDKQILFSRKISRNRHAVHAPPPSFHSWRALSRCAGDQRRYPLEPSSLSNALPKKRRRNDHSWSGSNTESRHTLAAAGARKSKRACAYLEDEPPNPSRLGAPREGGPRSGGRNSELPILQGGETAYARNSANCRLVQNAIRAQLFPRHRGRLPSIECELHDWNWSKGRLLGSSDSFGARNETTRSQFDPQACHAAPVPLSTAGMVRAKIFRSSHSDNCWMYCMSSSLHWWKGIEFLPFTCQRQVIPGRMLNRRRCQSSLNPSKSRTAMGLGPTRLISPFRTFRSCGNSSMLVRRRCLPIGVRRGSFLILNTGPD